jgi:hypothetical protein
VLNDRRILKSLHETDPITANGDPTLKIATMHGFRFAVHVFKTRLF